MEERPGTMKWPVLPKRYKSTERELKQGSVRQRRWKQIT
jgi:hypothetical protein